MDAYYFGVWTGRGAGHYMHDQHGNRVRADLPWKNIDGVLQPGAEKRRHPHDYVPLEEQIEGCAAVHYRDGWTALCFWDRSEDKRGGCNSNFFFKGAYTFEQMVELAKKHFPLIWHRFPFEVQLMRQASHDAWGKIKRLELSSDAEPKATSTAAERHQAQLRAQSARSQDPAPETDSSGSTGSSCDTRAPRALPCSALEEERCCSTSRTSRR